MLAGKHLRAAAGAAAVGGGAEVLTLVNVDRQTCRRCIADKGVFMKLWRTGNPGCQAVQAESTFHLPQAPPSFPLFHFHLLSASQQHIHPCTIHLHLCF